MDRRNTGHVSRSNPVIKVMTFMNIRSEDLRLYDLTDARFVREGSLHT